MNLTQCPDCHGGLKPGAGRCVCGWVMPPAHQVVTPHVVPCDECGKPGRRVGARIICEACETEERHRASEAFCEAKGLKTREERIAFCKKLARSFGQGPRFETWAKNIKQAAVDTLVLHDGKGDRDALDRLRAEGVIDEQNKVIPPGPARVAAKEAQRAERERALEELKKVAI